MTSGCCEGKCKHWEVFKIRQWWEVYDNLRQTHLNWCKTVWGPAYFGSRVSSWLSNWCKIFLYHNSWADSLLHQFDSIYLNPHLTLHQGNAFHPIKHWFNFSGIDSYTKGPGWMSPENFSPYSEVQPRWPSHPGPNIHRLPDTHGSLAKWCAKTWKNASEWLPVRGRVLSGVLSVCASAGEQCQGL